MKYALIFLILALVLFTACTPPVDDIDDGTPNDDIDDGTPNTSGIDDVFSDGDGITPPPIPS